jgi:hypothetical protein
MSPSTIFCKLLLFQTLRLLYTYALPGKNQRPRPRAGWRISSLSLSLSLFPFLFISLFPPSPKRPPLCAAGMVGALTNSFKIYRVRLTVSPSPYEETSNFCHIHPLGMFSAYFDKSHRELSKSGRFFINRPFFQKLRP